MIVNVFIFAASMRIYLYILNCMGREYTPEVRYPYVSYICVYGNGRKAGGRQGE